MALIPTQKSDMKSKGDRLPQFKGDLIDRPGWSMDRIAELGKYIKDRVDKGLQSKSMRDDRIRAWNLQYDAVYQPKSIPWVGSSALNIPTTRAIVDTLHAHTMRTLQGGSPLFRVEETSETDPVNANAIEKLLQFQAVQQIGMRGVWDEALRYAFKHGNSVVVPTWLRTMRAMRDVEPQLMHPQTQAPTTDASIGVPRLDGNGKQVMALVQRNRIDKDQPYVHVVNMLDWLLYPAESVDIESAIGCGWRSWMTKNDILQGVRNGVFSPQLVKELLANVRPLGNRAQDDTGGDPVVDELVGINANDALTDDERQYEIFNLLWKLDTLDDQGEENGICDDVSIAIERSSGRILSAQLYPYWHGRRNMINFCPYPRDKSFWGYAMPEILEHIHAERNAIRNQRVDVGSLLLSPMLAITKGVRYDPNRPFWKPGGVLMVDDVNQIKPISLGTNTQSAFAEENAAKEMAADVSGVNEYAQGQSPSRSRTVGEISTVTAEGNLKFDVVIGRINDANNEMIEQILQLDYQFLPEETEIAITGDNNVRTLQTVTRDQMRLRYRIQATGNTTNSNKELMIQVAETLYQISTTNPLISGDLTRIWAVSNFYLHQAGILDPTPYIGTQEAAAQQQQAKMSQPPPPPMQPVQVSGKLDEISTLALLMQSDPQLMQTLAQAFQVYQAAGATMASAQAAGNAHGTAPTQKAEASTPPPQGAMQQPGMFGAGGPAGAVPVDPNNPRVFPEQGQNNDLMAHIASVLASQGQGVPQ